MHLSEFVHVKFFEYSQFGQVPVNTAVEPRTNLESVWQKTKKATSGYVNKKSNEKKGWSRPYTNLFRIWDIHSR
jgi:hypothetical protein